MTGIEKLIERIEDVSQWGWLIASSTEDKWQQEIAEKALEYGKSTFWQEFSTNPPPKYSRQYITKCTKITETNFLSVCAERI